MPLPTIAIVGRPNVGKSTLFNRLVGKKLALVDDQPGVTRDRREGEAKLGDLRFTVIDTAGLEEGDAASLSGRTRAQTEAAMEIFRAQGGGHLVMISSISALRGMRKTITTYAATKAGVAALAEGLINEDVKGVDVSVIYPGYIRSEMNEKVAQRTKFMVDTKTGVAAMVDAIEKRKQKAYVPAWPWVPIGFALRNAPMSVVRKLV
jgi:NAD(P)-dependent dehydrogenase (short-subunit alcohol dehydrogenase family)